MQGGARASSHVCLQAIVTLALGPGEGVTDDAVTSSIVKARDRVASALRKQPFAPCGKDSDERLVEEGMKGH
jgi:hypothetical protein